MLTALVALAIARAQIHCLAKCNGTVFADPRLVCMQGNKPRCDTITYGNHAPQTSFLDEILRKAQHRCVTWEDTSKNWTHMKTCITSNDASTVIFVMSSRNNFNTRQAIRDTWANGHANVYFVVGKCCRVPPQNRKQWTCVQVTESSDAENESQQSRCDAETKQLAEENKQNANDVMVVDAIDVYRDLALKLRAIYQCAVHHPAVKWIVKTDDDSFIRVTTLEKYLNAAYDATTAVAIASSFARNSAPHTEGKWKEYNSIRKIYSRRYPPFPNGAVHIISQPLAQYIADHSNDLLISQGEDTSLAIWMDKAAAAMRVKLQPSRRIAAHGNCHDTSVWAIGHDITPAQMHACYKRLDEAQ